jgi:hypothetical protein
LGTHEKMSIPMSIVSKIFLGILLALAFIEDLSLI